MDPLQGVAAVKAASLLKETVARAIFSVPYLSLVLIFGHRILGLTSN